MDMFDKLNVYSSNIAIINENLKIFLIITVLAKKNVNNLTILLKKNIHQLNVGDISTKKVSY